MTNEINSDIIQLETLEKEFDVILNQYQEAYQTYLNNLNNPTSQKTFVALKGRSYWGTFGLQEKSVSTQKECESMCASDIKCTGATFNPEKRYCWTRGGEGSLTVGQPEDYALVYELRNNIIILKSLNEKLIGIYSSIERLLTNKVYPKMEKYDDIKKEKMNILKTQYTDLLDEKVKLNGVLQTLDNYNREYHNTTITVEQQNLSLRMWVVIAIIFIIFSFKVLSGEESGMLGNIVTLIILIIVGLVFYHYFRY